MKNIIEKGQNHNFKVEYTVHSSPKYLKKTVTLVCQNDLKNNYPNILDKFSENLLLIPTWQKSREPLNIINSNVSKEMDRLYLNIFNFAQKLRNHLKNINENYWLNGSSPNTGKCLFGKESGFIYNELESLSYLLKYPSNKIGCCGMIYHPELGEYGYPVTLFTNIDSKTLINILDNLKH